MKINLQLDDDLAERLRARAAAANLSLESCVTKVLESALESSTELKSWSQINARRFELIRKSREVDLTPSEVEELNLLQSKLGVLLESEDRKMLDRLSELECQLGVCDE